MTLLHRRSQKNRVERIRGDLVEGLGHLKSATSSAAEGVAEKAAPRVDSALTAVGIRKRRRRRWPWLIAAMTLGSAAGVAGALMWRRSTDMRQEMVGEQLYAQANTPQESSLDDMQLERHTMDSRSAQYATATAD